MTDRPRLYTDENIDGRLVRALRRAGWDLVRAVDLHPPGTDDETHFQDAADQDRLLVTNDDDMLALAADWLKAGREFRGVVYFHADRFARVGDALRAMEALASRLEADRPTENIVFYP